MIWGIDLGVRSYYAAGIDTDGSLTLHEHVLQLPKKTRVKDQAPTERAAELTALTQSLRAVISPWDQVFIEEPPMSGSRNVRTFLKLAQTSAAVAVAAGLSGVSAMFVPVDTWKMTVVGAGGASKETVALALKVRSRRYSLQCQGDQNRVDATCIALFGTTATVRGGAIAEALGVSR